MLIFSLKSCDTCRRAIRELKEFGHELDITDIRNDGISATDRARFLKYFGDKLVNRRSTTWRNLSETERELPALSLLERFPALMKRPVIDANGQLYLGWGDDVRDILLG